MFVYGVHIYEQANLLVPLWRPRIDVKCFPQSSSTIYLEIESLG